MWETNCHQHCSQLFKARNLIPNNKKEEEEEEVRMSNVSKNMNLVEMKIWSERKKISRKSQ